MSTDNIRRLYQAIARSGERLYQPSQATGVLSVASVERDSTGAIVSATGTLDGAGEFTVPLKGHQAAPGDYLLVGFPSNQPVGAELAYLRHVASDFPGAGIIAIDGTVPAPTFAATPWTTSIVKLPGSITAKASVFFVAVEARYQPSGYTVSYRIDGGEWRDRAVPHIGGVQECDLGSDLPPSASVDVHLRARYQWNASESVPTADSTFATADDNSSPGSVTALAVSVATPGQLSITPTATIDSALFRGYQYEINDAATGSPDITSAPIPGPWDAVLPPGTYYVAARPVSKSGTLGTRFPSTGFQGPYVVLDQTANLDTTPPGAIGAPTLTGSLVQFADNTWHGFLTVTRPSYTPPSDLAAYQISFVVDDGRNWIAEEAVQAGVTSWKYEVGFGQFTVAMRGIDQARNAPAFGSTAVATIAAPAFAGAAPTVTTTTVGAGIKAEWTPVTNALRYEVQRATTATPGAGLTYAAEVTADAPLIWLRALESTGTVATNSGSYGTNGTYNNSPTLHQQAPQGLYGVGFDGVDDYIEWPDNATLDITGNLTLEALVYPTTRADAQMIVTKATGAVGPYQWYLGITDGKPVFFDTNGSLGATAAPPLNQWSHLAVTRSGRVVTHYLNGTANGTATIAGAAPAATADPLRVGRRSEAAPQYHFVGRIAQVAIYTTVLTGTRLAAHSAAITNPPGLTVAVVDSLWYFDPLTDDTLILPSYWYRARGLSTANGVVQNGTYSAWVQGTVGAVDAQNLRLLSVTTGLLAADSVTANKILAGTIDATKLAATLVITQILKTALSGARWELEGHTGSGTQDQLRFLDSSGVLLMLLNATGLSFYGSASQGDFSLARNGSGRGQLTMGAMSVGTDGTGPFVSIPLTTTGGGGEVRFGGSSANARLREQDYGGLSAVGFTKLNGTIGDPALVLYDNVGGGSGSEKLALYWDGIGSDNAAISEYTFRHASGRWASNIPLNPTGVYIGTPDALGFSATPYGQNHPTALGTTGGDVQRLGIWLYPSGTATMGLQLLGYRGQSNTNAGDARYVFGAFTSGVSNDGELQLGRRNASDPFVALSTGFTSRLYWDHANTRIEIPNGLHITGALSKGSGSFVIPDPTPGRAGWELRHCFAEAPTRGENLYTYVASFGPRGGGLRVLDPEGQPLAGATIARVDDGTPAKWAVTIPLPDYWPHLNEQPRAMAHNTGDGWGRCKARVGDDLTSLTLLAEEGGAYTIDLRGTRKDDVARAWWDRRGVRKTQAQRWTNEATAERRAAQLAARGKRAGAGAPPTPVEPPTGTEFAATMAAVERGEYREQTEEVSWF